MAVRSTVSSVLVVLLVALVAVSLAGSVFGQPIVASYVETGSMEPALDPGDGFVAVPTEIAGPIEEGDVITFEAEKLNGGGLITHRVVETTKHGYVTKGDANPNTDQAGREPHVTDGQIAAKALQVNGEVVVVPHLGTAAMGVGAAIETVQTRLAGLLGTTAVLGTQGLASLLFTFGAGFLVVSALFERGRRTRDDRSRTRTRKDSYHVGRIIIAFALLIGLVAAGTMVAASETHEHGIVSAEFDSERPNVIPIGETEQFEVTLTNDGVLPMVAVLEPTSGGVEVESGEQYIERGGVTETTLSLTAPPETGYYLRTVSEYRYFVILPPSIIFTLHAIHPWVAYGTITAMIVLAFTLPFALLLGTNGQIRVRERTRKTDSKIL